jgi:hypothetical protein
VLFGAIYMLLKSDAPALPREAKSPSAFRADVAAEQVARVQPAGADLVVVLDDGHRYRTHVALTADLSRELEDQGVTITRERSDGLVEIVAIVIVLLVLLAVLVFVIRRAASRASGGGSWGCARRPHAS